MSCSDESKSKIFTIGHSNHSMEAFLNLLEKTGVDVVVDVRSAPYSRFSPHFNQDSLKFAVGNAEKEYIFLGNELGGKPKDESFYDDEGYVIYSKIAATRAFKLGIERVENDIPGQRVALLCGEEDPSQCHRRLLVGKVLVDAGYEMMHIRGDGRIQSDDALLESEVETPVQMMLFAEPKPEKPWRSARPLVPRKIPN